MKVTFYLLLFLLLFIECDAFRNPIIDAEIIDTRFQKIDDNKVKFIYSIKNNRTVIIECVQIQTKIFYGENDIKNISIGWCDLCILPKDIYELEYNVYISNPTNISATIIYFRVYNETLGMRSYK